MAITRRAPNTILLASNPGKPTVNDYPAGGAITPGMLIELYNDTVLKFRANASATEIAAACVALDQIEMNKGISDAYAVGDLVKAHFLDPGDVFYGIIPSGQNITQGALLQSNGDGKLKAATATTQDAGLGRFQALDSPGSVLADTRVRVQVIQ